MAEAERDIKNKILEALKQHPEGLTIENLSDKIGAHRHTITKYIFELKGEGIIHRRVVGSVTLHYLKGDYQREFPEVEPAAQKEAVAVEQEAQRETEPVEAPKKFELERPSFLKAIPKALTKRPFRYLFLVLPLFSLLYFFGPQLTGFFILGDTFTNTNALYVTMENSWNGNEFYLYTLIKENYAGNVTKIPITDMLHTDLSGYNYMVISTDAGSIVTDEICELIANSSIPFIYSSRNFHSKCSDELSLTSGSICGSSESPVWDIVNNSFYPTSHISTPQKVRVFEEKFSVDLCGIEGSESAVILAARDQAHGYLVIFEDNLQKRAFFAFPNKDYPDLTDDGKMLLERTILWLIS